MKKCTLIALILLLAALLCTGACAAEEEQAQLFATTSGSCGDSLTWEMDTATGTLTISGTGEMSESGTAPWLGSYKNSIGTVVIEPGATSIRASAFNGCSSLTAVTIPNSVTTIGTSAFNNCSSLTSITIPSSVTDIGGAAFRGCSALAEVHITDLAAWCNITFGEYTYTRGNPLNYSHKLYVNGELVTDLVIPEGVTAISDYAFYGCSTLKSATIPDSVTSIGESVFAGCSGLERITIPFVGDSRKTASDTYQYPFGYLFGKSSYTGGVSTSQSYYAASTTSDISGSYYIPSSLKSVTITGGNILHGAFSNCKNLTSVIMPDGLSAIESRAFSGCSGLTAVTIPNQVTDIGDRAFYNCSALATVAIPDRVTTIKSSTFEGCKNLTSVTIGKGVTAIESRAFYGCSSLAAVHTTDLAAWCNITFEAPANNPLNNAKKLYLNGTLITDLVIPDGVTTIKNYAFYNCTALTSAAIPNSVTSIGEGVFAGCSGLERMAVPFLGEARKTADDTNQYPLGYFFGTSTYTGGTQTRQYYYKSSTETTELSIYYIPARLKSVTVTGGNILRGAFSNCINLTSVTILDGPTSIETEAFNGCSGLTAVTIPASVTTIGGNAFKGCSSLASVSIPASVTAVGNDAFVNCSALAEVHITDLAAWCDITFGNSSGNPLYYAKKLYLNGERMRSLTVPDGVTAIRDYVFYNGADLTGVTIPDSVTTVGKSAFQGCTALATVSVGSGVTSMGSDAFSGCTALSVVNVADVGAWCGITFPLVSGRPTSNPIYHAKQFYVNGQRVVNLTIPAGTAAISDNAFYNCTALATLTIPDSVAAIGAKAFYGCSNLESVNVGEGVTAVGSGAFSGCSGLDTVHITDLAAWCGISFEDSGSNPLSTARKLYLNDERVTDLVIPNGVTAIKDYAFYCCSTLTSLTIPEGVTSIGAEAFYNCETLTSVVAPKSMASMGEAAFYGCYAMQSVSVTDLAAWCAIDFGNSIANPLCYAHNLYLNDELVTDLVLPDSLTVVKNYTFYNCTSLTSVTAPDGIDAIGNSAFASCRALKWMEFLGNAPTLGSNALPALSSDHDFVLFYHDGTTGWSSPTWNGYVCVCADAPLGDVTGLNGDNRNSQGILFTLDETGIAVVGDGSDKYNNCGYHGENGGEVVIPDTVTKGNKTYRVVGVSANAFYGNSQVRTVQLGKNVSEVTPSAFGKCPYLTGFSAPESGYFSVEDGILYDETKAYLYCYPSGKPQEKFTVPATVRFIYTQAFSGCDTLKEVVVPETVTLIQAGAFCECTGLEKMTLPFIGGSQADANRFDYIFSYSGYFFDAPIPVKEVVITGEGLKGQDFEYSEYAYNTVYAIERITLPTVGSSIPEGSFADCAKLKSVRFADCDLDYQDGVLLIPGSVTTIGSRAFAGCAGFTSVVIPRNVTTIGYGAFAGCSGVEEYKVDPANTAYCADKWGVLFNKSKTTLINYPAARKWFYYNVPDVTTEIQSSAFRSCGNLVNLYIPRSVTYLADSAIYNCDGLTCCVYQGSAADVYASANNELRVWYMDGATVRGIEVHTPPKELVQPMGETDLDGLYVVVNMGKPLQLDDYEVSYGKPVNGVQTVTISAMGKTATFDMLRYDGDRETAVNFGRATIPDGGIALAASYKDGAMLHVREAVAFDGNLHAILPAADADRIALFRLDSHYAPVGPAVESDD